jgi:hypothetical protein
LSVLVSDATCSRLFRRKMFALASSKDSLLLLSNKIQTHR